MAIYRNIQLSFWSDSKVTDDFTPEDKYFYLYLLTNPQTNICGCYQISYSQIENQTGYNRETINRLIVRFEKIHNVIRFCADTKEILILNWHKYNLNKSEKTLTGAESVANYIKTPEFKEYVFHVIDCIRNDTPCMGYQCPIQASVSVSVSDTVSDNIVKKSRSKKEIPAYFPNDESLNQAFLDYMQLRKQIKKPMTEKAIELAIKKLRELATAPFSDAMDSNLAVQILNQSILNSWQGLFPLKQQKTICQHEKGGDAVGSNNQGRGQAADYFKQFIRNSDGNEG